MYQPDIYLIISRKGFYKTRFVTIIKSKSERNRIFVKVCITVSTIESDAKQILVLSSGKIWHVPNWENLSALHISGASSYRLSERELS